MARVLGLAVLLTLGCGPSTEYAFHPQHGDNADAVLIDRPSFSVLIVTDKLIGDIGTTVIQVAESPLEFDLRSDPVTLNGTQYALEDGNVFAVRCEERFLVSQWSVRLSREASEGVLRSVRSGATLEEIQAALLDR